MKIVIIKTSSLGDIIQTFPVIDYLRSQIPQVSIDWVVEAPFSALVSSHPHLNTVVTIETKVWRKRPFSKTSFQSVKASLKKLRQERYDVAIDLQGNTKSGIILGVTRANEKIGFASDSLAEWPNRLFTRTRYSVPKGKSIREDYLSIAEAHFGKRMESFKETPVILKLQEDEKLYLETIKKSLCDKYRVMVCPGAAWPTKQVTSELLCQFLRTLLQRRPCEIFLTWGTEQEKKIAQQIHSHFRETSRIFPRLSLPLLQNTMAEMDLVIAMDSLPLHLCGLTKTPTFSFFGPSAASKYQPLGSQHSSLQGSCPYGITFEKRCPRLRTCETGQCMHSFQESSKEWQQVLAFSQKNQENV